MSNQATYCGHCGNSNESASQFCRGCGQALSTSAANPTSKPAPFPTGPAIPAFAGGQTGTAANPKTGNRSMIAIILGVLGLLMCGPLTTVPGAIMAWMDINEAKQSGQPVPGLATLAFWGNVALTVLVIAGGALMMMMFVLMAGM